MDLVGILAGLLFPINEDAESVVNRADAAAVGHLSCLPFPPHSVPPMERSSGRGKPFERWSNFIQERLGIKRLFK